jgi:DNA-binding transcriptional MerR regulator
VKGTSRFLKFTWLDPLDPNTIAGGWRERGMPIADIKTIMPARVQPSAGRTTTAGELYQPWQEVQAIIETKKGEQYYARESFDELMVRVNS